MKVQWRQPSGQASTQILFLNFGEKEALHCLKLCAKLRRQNISADMYPDKAKIKKQMNFANKKNAPYVALVGQEEIANNSVTIKNMKSGEQKTLPMEELSKELESGK